MAWVPLTIDRQLGNRAKQDGRRFRFKYRLRSAQWGEPFAGCVLDPAASLGCTHPQQQSVFAPICLGFVIELWWQATS